MTSHAQGPVTAISRTPLTLKLTVAALAGAGILSSASVWAQDAVAADSTSVVTVSGVRKAAQSAQTIKRNADEVLDSIVAEEAGKFPDKNVAEMLGRITGVQIRRENGEAREVVIRGLPGLVTLLNGREMFTAGKEGRSLYLADIPAAMLQRVDVYKTQGADMVEGGTAGVIDVRTARPFDAKGFTASVTGRVENRDKSKTNDPNLSGMISNRWKTGYGEIGALLGLSYQDGNYHDEVTWNSPPKDRAADLGAGISAPDELGHVLYQGQRKRVAANLALQWRPNADLEFFAEGISTEIHHDAERQFYVGSLGLNKNSSYTLIPGTNQVQTATSTNANPFALGSTQAPHDYSLGSQGAIGARWNAAPGWRVTTELARTLSRVRQEFPIVDLIAAPPTITGNTYVNGGAQFSYPGYDMTNPNNYRVATFFDNHNHAEGRSTDWRADATWSPDNDGVIKEVSSGVRVAKRTAAYVHELNGFQPAPGNIPLASVPGLACNSMPMAGDYGMASWVTPCASYMHDNIASLRTLFNVNGNGTRTGDDKLSQFNNQETTYAIYTKAKYGFRAGAIPVDGTVGVRVVRTNGVLNGYSQANGVILPVSSSPTSTDVLPNATLKAMILPEVQARLTAGKSVQRANFDQFNPGVSYNVPSTTVQAVGTGGNPDLKPIEGKNFDAAAEWYFAPTGSLTATLFRHDFKNYILTSSTKETYNGIVYDVNRPRNMSKGKLQGAELSYQQFYDKLPGWLGGFGLQANVTYMKGELTDTGGVLKPFVGMSKLSYNIVGLYERDGWSGRLAYNWRDKYVDTFNYRGLGFDLIVDPIKTTDASISYKISDAMSVTMDVENLLDRKYHDYHGVASNPRDIRRYDRVVGLSLRYKM
ncbi:TonB-dependent receptor [Massilia antarctica]|uniref:TonB-dependent receptor n=1 Tax=Massilia antarctica TaxID=2765360 RepID=UPI0006BB5C65|nr:TonB-dependent receptor [Massilia sp. H27-R4]MCY0911553.1 TonB-dependent receptor [Massilia sp. H27-R4]CUI04831.1 N-acetylglucosamine-regulated TonB-dependent outer membrane receptor [Janthinobacterium sp. CG23_2]CUU28617.1 N-acetylglucosamine-regulated TonB-dependent outer membrane receptor [Janthinobacterium sp. CG23_2]